MKLGVSYNLFDGEELLVDSIKSIRDSVDVISVVYQRESNYGQKCNPDLPNILHNLSQEGLINIIKQYEPINTQNIGFQGSLNEIKKRNIGLNLSRERECTHHLGMDTDEFYIKDEFDNIKGLIEEHNLDASGCKMQTYYKLPTMVLDPPEDYYVPFIFKVYPHTKFVLGGSFPVLVDPTRRINTHNKFTQIGRKGIQMHHMSYVRKSIKNKLHNSSAKLNFGDKLDKFISYWENWKNGDDALLAGVDEVYYKLKQVKNIFNINIE